MISLKRSLAMAGAAVLTVATTFSPAAAMETIKIGVLHSLSGTMAISDTTLKDSIQSFSIRLPIGPFLPKKRVSF